MTASMSDTEFRHQVRAWLCANLPEDMVRRSRTGVHPSKDDMLGVVATLHRAGWSVPQWPIEHGGPGWSAMRAFIFEEELTLAGGSPNNIQGVSLAGPVIYTFGTPAQKERYLPAIREGREFWAQGFSEPNSGSDLASLRTRAVRDGDVYVVDGQKIWTSQAMYADMLFCLVRTDPNVKPQKGISFLLIDMKSPGITVRPIRSIDEGESLCEVFFDAVRVPADNLVGEEGKGWDYAKFLLGNERVQTAEVPRNKLYLARLKTLAAAERRGAVALIDDPVFRHRIAQAEIDLIGLESAVVGAIDANDASALTPSALKIVGTELMQAQLGMQVEALGSKGAVVFDHSGHALPGAASGPEHAGGVLAEFLFRRAATIYGGSTEVQKNIIAKLLFAGDEGAAAALTEDQALLRDTAERYAQREQSACGAADEAPWSPERATAGWQRFVQTGLIALALPEEVGGFGGAAELAVVCETLGAGLVPEPVVAVGTLAARVIDGLSPACPHRTPLLRALADGRPMALADEEPDGPGAPRATRARAEGDAYRIEGIKCVVPAGAIAEAFIVVAEVPGEGPALFLVDAAASGLHVERYRSVDGQGLADLRLDAVRVPGSARLSAATPVDALLGQAQDWGLVMACADAVGAMAQALRITRDYLVTRRQFGSALSEFQALRHRLAEMYAELAIARALVRRGVGALAGDAEDRGRIATACKARVGAAAMFVANQAVQLHGGIGMTDAYVIGRYYKRLFAFDRLMGDRQHQVRRFARLHLQG